MSEIIIGIDFGTTYSVMAYVDSEGRAALINNAEGKILTPSVVLIENDEVIVGDPAANLAKIKPDNVKQWIKREIGTDEKFHGYSPIEIASQIIGKLKHDAEIELSQSIEKAVITCPAYFTGPEVENTKKAGELAGLEVMEIVREPTAAAVFYGVEHLKDREKVLVFDLGGGTFDATILELRDGKFSPLATLGERQLGGHDFTTALLGYVIDKFSDIFGEDPTSIPVVHQALYERCETAKRDLSLLDKVVIPCVLRDKTAQVEVTSETFNILTKGFIEATVFSSQMVLHKVKPPLTWDDIDKILLVGGSTRLRRVREVLQEISGKVPIQTGEVDTMVALGAAMIAKGMVRPRRSYISLDPGKTGAAGLISSIPIHLDRPLVRNLGTRVIVWEEKTAKIINSTIIPYGTLAPTEKTRDDYATAVRNQIYFDLPIVEFDDIGVDEIVGTYRFSCPPGSPAGNRIAVTFKYDISGIPEVEARDVQTGQLLPKEKVKYEEPDLDNQGSFQTSRRVVFALDVSGSMHGDKLIQAKQALLETAEALLQHGRGEIEVGLITFGTSAWELCDLTGDLDLFTRKMGGISLSGSTRMDLGIEIAAKLLRGQVGHHTCEIALVTDGMPDSESATLRAAATAREAGIHLLAVRIGAKDVDENFLRQVAGGEFQIVESAAQLRHALPNLLMQTRGDQGAAITWGSKE